METKTEKAYTTRLEDELAERIGKRLMKIPIEEIGVDIEWYGAKDTYLHWLCPGICSRQDRVTSREKQTTVMQWDGLSIKIEATYPQEVPQWREDYDTRVFGYVYLLAVNGGDFSACRDSFVSYKENKIPDRKKSIEEKICVSLRDRFKDREKRLKETQQELERREAAKAEEYWQGKIKTSVDNALKK